LLLPGCALAPSIIGFPHPDPLPRGGHELAGGLGGGLFGADMLGYESPAGTDSFLEDPPWLGWGVGGHVSYAARVGAIGLSATMSAANVFGWAGHLAIHIPVADGDPETPDRVVVGVGAGFFAVGDTSFRPDLAFEVLLTPLGSGDGAFGGVRVTGGPVVSALDPDEPRVIWGAVGISGAIGYRWAIGGGRTWLHLQFVPIVDVGIHIEDDDVFVAGGGIGLFGFTFGLP